MPAGMTDSMIDEGLVTSHGGDPWPEVDLFLQDRWIRLVADDLQGQMLELGPASTQTESIDWIASLERLIATASSVLAAEEVSFARTEKER